jgi:regulatory protein
MEEAFVTDIVKLTQKKVKVVLEDDIAFSLYNSELRKYHITIGSAISAEEWEEIRKMLYKRLLTRALTLLKDKDYAVGELVSKFKKSVYPMAIIDEVIERLKSEKFLDDKRFAENYVMFHAEQKNRKQIEQFLYRKGIPEDLVDAALEEYAEDNPDSEVELAFSQLKKKVKPAMDLSDYETKMKLKSFLYRKGFEFSVIDRAIERLEKEENG